MQIVLNTEAFFSSLSIMAKGMLGVFVVMGIFIAVVLLLNKTSSKKRETRV